MNKILITILLLVSINSYAIEVNCSQLASSAFSEKIRNDLGNICKLDKFKEMVFLDNPNNIIANQYMKQGYFFLIDTLNSLVGMPTNIYNYFFSACGNDVDHIACNSCIKYDILKRDISDTKLGNQTGFSILREIPSSCINAMIYLQDDNCRIFGYVIAGMIGVPFAIFVIVMAGIGITNHIITPCYKYCKSVNYSLYIQNTKSKVKELLVKDKTINDYNSINLKEVP
jgi:hypothetical protein